ncbi:YopX family protein [Enterococcus dispar]|uniref:YopX family protein n=1 Tax=Enterococcus dispar TaxID=44009 RepID=UPI00288D562D|nr:YopX family protein [Enterococcus dispar]MDT2705745.1 YopX family protein [Enterococcus dispar]
MIKFRAFLKSTKDIREILVIDYLNRVVDLEGGEIEQYFEDVILMQSTGLKDLKGVEIYEGDILKCTSGIYTNLGATRTGEYEETIKQVIWKDDSWGTRVISSNLTSKGAEKSGLVISAKYAEIIGNIYEQPELMEGASK